MADDGEPIRLRNPMSENQAIMRRTDYEEAPAAQRFLIGAGKTFADTGMGVRQAFNYATGDTDELSRLTSQQAENERLAQAVGDDFAGGAGQLTAGLGMALPGAGVASMLTAGRSMLPRMLGQGAAGAVELPMMMPATDSENFGGQLATKAGLGFGLGSVAELAIASPALLAGQARRGTQALMSAPKPAGQQAGRLASLNQATPSIEREALEAGGIGLAPAQARFLDAGDTQGLAAMERAKKMQGTELQSRMNAFEEQQGREVADALNRYRGDYTGIGEDVSGRLSAEVAARKEAADNAWKIFRDDHKDDVVLDPEARTQVLNSLRETLVNTDPNALSRPARRLSEYLESQLAMDGRNTYYTAQGIDGLRRDIRNIRSEFSANPEEAFIVDQVGRALNDILGEISGSSPATSALRDATSKSRDYFSLTRDKDSVVADIADKLSRGLVGPETVLDRLVSGRGDKGGQFLRDIKAKVGEDMYVSMRDDMKRAAIAKALGKKITDLGGELTLTNPMGYKAVADQLLQFFDQNKALSRELFDQAEIDAMRTLARGIRQLAPNRNVTNFSNTAGWVERLTGNVGRKVPLLSDVSKNISEDIAEKRLGVEIFGDQGQDTFSGEGLKSAARIIDKMLGGIERTNTGLGALSVPIADVQ